MAEPTHIPVLLTEVIQSLAVKPGGRYVDCTVGGGGHASAILEHSYPGGQLLGIDADPRTVERAERRLKTYQDSILLVNDNFVNLRDICTKHGFFPVHGILFDLGLSSYQLNGDGRGFSFQHDAPLDMRLNPGQKLTAADILNTYSETKLANLIHNYGEERYSRQIARAIVQERPVETTSQLVRIVEKSIRSPRGKIHPATKTFQALRIAVNYELENLETALEQAVSLLGFEGRLAIITYHSLEDRIVKNFLKRESRDCLCPPTALTCVCKHTRSLRIVNNKIVTPSPAEVRLNPRSRSAKLRVAERIIVPSEAYNIVEKINSLPGLDNQGWRRPALVERLRRTFISLQVEYF